MAANLTPQYLEAHKKLRTAVTPAEKIEIYEELLRLIPKHKATEKMVAQHRSKIAKLKEEMLKPSVSGKHGWRLVPHRKDGRRTGHPGRAAELRQVVPGQGPDRGRARRSATIPSPPASPPPT